MAGSDLVARINGRLAAGERLLKSARMVMDTDEHRLWRSSRDLWVDGSIRDLESHENVAGTFRRAATPAAGEGTIAEDLPVEMEAVRHGMAVLIATRARLDEASKGATADPDRRGPRLGP